MEKRAVIAQREQLYHERDVVRHDLQKVEGRARSLAGLLATDRLAAVESFEARIARLRWETATVTVAHERLRGRLEALHASALATEASFLPADLSAGPIRRHNEAVLHRLLAVIGSSGASPEASMEAAQLAAAEAVAAAAEAGAAAVPWRPAEAAPREDVVQAAQQQAQGTQQVIDLLEAKVEQARESERALRGQVEGIRIRLQYQGSEPRMRCKVCAELGELTDPYHVRTDPHNVRGEGVSGFRLGCNVGGGPASASVLL